MEKLLNSAIFHDQHWAQEMTLALNLGRGTAKI